MLEFRQWILAFPVTKFPHKIKYLTKWSSVWEKIILPKLYLPHHLMFWFIFLSYFYFYAHSNNRLQMANKMSLLGQQKHMKAHINEFLNASTIDFCKITYKNTSLCIWSRSCFNAWISLRYKNNVHYLCAKINSSKQNQHFNMHPGSRVGLFVWQ